MQYAIVGQANILSLPVVAKASGNPITAGTVNFYLVAKDGDNAGKWYRGADTSWQVAESIAGVATHRADGHWYLSLPSGVWTEGVRYALYAKESGNLHIPVGEDVFAILNVADAVWDAVLTGATHNDPTSAGRRLRTAQSVLIIHEGTADGPGAGDNTIELQDTASAVDDFYHLDWIIITDGTGVGQMRHIDSYVGLTNIATLASDWHTNPDDTSEYIVMARSQTHTHEIADAGLAQIRTQADDALTAYAPNKVVPDAAGTAPALHGTTNELIAALNNITAAQVVAALMADTGITEGGTMTFEKLMKIMAAWIAGKWQSKTGSTTVKELLDADDGETVILEMTPKTTTPYRSITVKI